jgi:hypothetical protein
MGIEKSGLATFMFFLGVPFFFYALLRPWGKAMYYGIMCIIIIIIIALYVTVGIAILTKTQEKAIGEYMGFIGIEGIIVGIIGIFRFRGYD